MNIMKKVASAVLAGALLFTFAAPAGATVTEGVSCENYTGSGGNRTVRVCSRIEASWGLINSTFYPQASFREVQGDVYQVKIGHIGVFDFGGTDASITFDGGTRFVYDYFRDGAGIDASTHCNAMNDPDAIQSVSSFAVKYTPNSNWVTLPNESSWIVETDC